jgi:ABC-type phosphate/phosphonate transport system substrate-binding protein
MIASLGMYDFGSIRAANDRLWVLIRTALRDHGIAAPEDLTRGDAAYWPTWTSPDLVLSQTCGYPFRARLQGKVTYVGTPDYGVEGCPPGYYRSVFVARADDPRRALAAFDGARFAYNDALSQSGWAAPQTHAARVSLYFPATVETGGHLHSARAVAEGRADLAALDAVTHALMQGTDPVADALRVVGVTDPSPGLPVITARGQDPDPIFAALGQAIAVLAAGDRQTLRLRGLVRIPLADYLAVPNPPPPRHSGASI